MIYYEDVMEAMKTIKKYCDQFADCADCDCFDSFGRGCLFENDPLLWITRKEDEDGNTAVQKNE